MRVRLSASAPKGEPQPCIRQSPRAPASHGSAARRDAPGSRTASPGDRPIPRGSSSRRTTVSARNGHPPIRSCKLGSSSGRLTPWSLAPGSSLVPFPFLPVHRSVRLLLLPPFSFPEEARLLGPAASTTILRYQVPGTRRIHQMGYYWTSPACSELPRTPSRRSSQSSPSRHFVNKGRIAPALWGNPPLAVALQNVPHAPALR